MPPTIAKDKNVARDVEVLVLNHYFAHTWGHQTCFVGTIVASRRVWKEAQALSCDKYTHTKDVFTSMSIHLPSEKTHTTTHQASKPTSKHAEMSFQQPSEKTEMKSIAPKQYHATQMIWKRRFWKDAQALSCHSSSAFNFFLILFFNESRSCGRSWYCRVQWERTCCLKLSKIVPDTFAHALA